MKLREGYVGVHYTSLFTFLYVSCSLIKHFKNKRTEISKQSRLCFKKTRQSQNQRNKVHRRDIQKYSFKSVIKALWEEPKALCSAPTSSDLEIAEDLRSREYRWPLPWLPYCGMTWTWSTPVAARCLDHGEPVFPWTHADSHGRGSCKVSGKPKSLVLHSKLLRASSLRSLPSPLVVPALHSYTVCVAHWFSKKLSGSKTPKKSNDGRKGNMTEEGYMRGF